jgi:hypothetical protein
MTQNSILAPLREVSNTPNGLNRGTITRIFRTVKTGNAFIFYEDLGKPTGDLATNLFEFCRQISEATSKCLGFHLKRGDFENWIRDTIGDVELANRIGKFKNNELAWKEDAMFKNQLHVTVRNRIMELSNYY